LPRRRGHLVLQHLGPQAFDGLAVRGAVGPVPGRAPVSRTRWCAHPLHRRGFRETLLLLYGNPSWSFPYRKMISGLKEGFRCVALDFPGHGMSDAPPGYGFTPREHSAVLERFVDRLGLTDLTIMVQDWGGPIGLGFAGRRPELVRSLIIGNTFAWPLTHPRTRAFSWIMGGPVGRVLTRTFNLCPGSSSGEVSRIASAGRCCISTWPHSEIPLAGGQRSSHPVSSSPHPASLPRSSGASQNSLTGRRRSSGVRKTSRSARPSASGSSAPSPSTRRSCSTMPRTSCRRTSVTRSPMRSRRFGPNSL